MVIGLKLADQIATSKGYLVNTMIRIRVVEGTGRDATTKNMNVVFDFYESRARFDAGDAPLQTFEDQRRTVTLPLATEESISTLHTELKAILTAEGKTVTDETA